MLHAYQSGLGVELMAASDNVLRGGLTPKHIDVPELLALLDPTPAPPPVLAPEALPNGVERFAVAAIPDFALLRAQVDGVAEIAVDGVAIALATSGELEVTGGATGEHVTLIPGCAVLVTADEGVLAARGAGELFVATPGA